MDDRQQRILEVWAHVPGLGERDQPYGVCESCLGIFASTNLDQQHRCPQCAYNEDHAGEDQA